MIIEYMLISGIAFNYDNIIQILSMKAFAANKIHLFESKNGVFVTCGIDIGKPELKQLYRDIKKATGATYVESRFYEK